MAKNVNGEEIGAKRDAEIAEKILRPALNKMAAQIEYSYWEVGKMSKPTPGPWEYFVEKKTLYDQNTGEKIESIDDWIVSPGKEKLAVFTQYLVHDGRLIKSGGGVNACHVIKCVNMHDELVEALKKAKGAISLDCKITLDIVERVLAKVEGGEG